MISIFVIDDHPITIDGIKSAFSSGEDKIKVSGWATSVKEAIPKLKRSRAKVVILDLIMPEISGVEFCLQIKKQFPEKKVIALTGEMDPIILHNTWINMADGIIMKYCSKEELVNTIHSVLNGKRVIGDTVPGLAEMIDTDKDKKSILTISEHQVLILLAKGYSSKEAAKILDSSQNAVEFHRKNMIKKFGVKNITSVINEARKLGLIT